MNLLPIEKQEEGCAAANIHIRCINGCFPKGVYHRADYANITWNQAAKEGWMWDQEGEPYKAYYCKECSLKLINKSP